MDGPSVPMTRPSVPEADRMVGVKVPVLSHGYVVLVDYMGDDGAIVQAARVSYGAGTRTLRDDRGLIRYLMRHRHTTPFEMVEFKFLVRLPIYVARQWIRHRTACLAADVRVSLARPGATSRSASRSTGPTIGDLWARLHPLRGSQFATRARIGLRAPTSARLSIRQLDERRGTLGATRLVSVTRSGLRPVFRLTVADGRSVECTADHRFLFREGWRTLAAATGLREEGGRAVWTPGDYELFVAPTELGPIADPADAASPCPREPDPRPAGPHRAPRPQLERVAAFEYLGIRMTYDLGVEGPSHNFLANGFVTHNSVNEYSARYSIVPDEYEVPAAEEVRYQSQRSRQGGEQAVAPEVAEGFRRDLDRIARDAYAAYGRALEAGIARETARLVLPLSYYTQWYWKIDLWNLLHFLSLRLDAHAQEEIRLYAAEIAKLGRVVCPVAFEAFDDFVLGSLSLSRKERSAVRALLAGATPERACEAAGLPLARKDGKPMTSGEGVEFLEKLEALRSSGGA
jgi:flavin-dependent thymidylate synthase